MKFAFLILRLVQYLPLSIIHAIARGIGNVLYLCLAKRRNIGLTNLQKCFPSWSHAQCKTVIRHHYQQMAILVLEYGVCWYSSTERLQKLVHYKNKHYLDEALGNGDKVILLYPHFTSFELAVYRLNQDVPLISVYSKQKNEAMDAQVLKGRHRYDNVYLVARTDGLRSIIKTIRKLDAPFLYLPDQDFGAKDSIFVNFFGQPAATITGLSRISAMTHAKVIPAIPVRNHDGTVTLQFYPAWEDFPTKDVVADTQRMNDFIEARVREHPEQYFWLHKRFKTRPEGEKDWY